MGEEEEEEERSNSDYDELYDDIEEGVVVYEVISLGERLEIVENDLISHNNMLRNVVLLQCISIVVLLIIYYCSVYQFNMLQDQCLFLLHLVIQ